MAHPNRTRPRTLRLVTSALLLAFSIVPLAASASEITDDDLAAMQTAKTEHDQAKARARAERETTTPAIPATAAPTPTDAAPSGTPNPADQPAASSDAVEVVPLMEGPLRPPVPPSYVKNLVKVAKDAYINATDPTNPESIIATGQRVEPGVVLPLGTMVCFVYTATNTTEPVGGSLIWNVAVWDSDTRMGYHGLVGGVKGLPEPGDQWRGSANCVPLINNANQ